MIPIEDNFEDIVGKAMRGMNIAPGVLSFLTEVPEDTIEALLDGKADESALRKIASTLGLHADTLVERSQEAWKPAPVDLEGLRQINTPYQDFSVNSYLVWDSHTMEAALFDTGSAGEEAHSLYQALGLDVKQVFITHTHIDHIMALDDVLKWTTPEIHSCAHEPVANTKTFQPGDTFRIGGLTVSTRLTRGHSPGGITYVIEGLDKPVAIVGDALFCQSMGGGVVSYQDALATNRKELFTLANDTIVCPGHGPMTTIGEEKAHNPFFPELK